MKRSAALSMSSVVAGGVVALPALYVALLSVAALAGRARRTHQAPATTTSLAVLVPAHNESALISRCLEGLAAQDYPSDRFRVFVIADNCDDDTAAIARTHGATALERNDPLAPGKGRALRWAMDTLLQWDVQVDAFVVIDADSVTDPSLLSSLASAHAAGVQVAQADYGALLDGAGDGPQLRAAAFLLFNRVRPTGKAALGLPCGLLGNGMLFSREIAEQHPWSAFSEVEDVEYGVQLRVNGIRPAYIRRAVLKGPVSTTGQAAEIQRTRWEGGRFRIAREYLPQIAREIARNGRRDLWDVAADLSSPPVGMLTIWAGAGTGGVLVLRALGVVGNLAVAPWLVASVAIPVHVLVGLIAGEAPPQMLQALVGAPRLVLADAAIRLRLLRSGKPDGWSRTPREDVHPNASRMR